MSVLNVNKETVAEISAFLTKFTGEDVLNGIQSLAAIVSANTGNAIMEAFTENCKEMQAIYNDKACPACKSLTEEYMKFEELHDAIQKGAQSLTAVKKVDADLNVAAVDVPNLSM